MKRYQQSDMLNILKMHIFKKYNNKQTNLAKKFGMSDAYISLIMLGEKPIPEWLAKDMGYKRIDPKPFYLKVKK